MSFYSNTCEFAVVGAGPYGLAVASHLRAAGFETRIFGKVMDFWHSQMPVGMRMRSPWEGTHIADPHRHLTLNRYAAAVGYDRSRPLHLNDFVAYGRWFQHQSLPDLDPRSVSQVTRVGDGYRVTLEDGGSVSAQRVIVATGIGSFANCPPPFAGLPAELVSHTSDPANRDLGRFAGRRVVIVGSGQSAVESAALLSEAGAEVELLARQPSLRWLKTHGRLEWLMDRKWYPFKAPGRIGPIGINWLLEVPGLFTLFPRRAQDWMTFRAIRPAASSWLRPRTQAVAFRTGIQAVAANARHGKIELRLSDGSECTADHVLLGTGYKIDIARYRFLTPELLQSVRTANGYPVLDKGFASSVPGLYFVGTTAAYSFGPVCRFVAGTPYTAATLTKHARKKPAPRHLATTRV